MRTHNIISFFLFITSVSFGLFTHTMKIVPIEHETGKKRNYSKANKDNPNQEIIDDLIPFAQNLLFCFDKNPNSTIETWGIYINNYSILLNHDYELCLDVIEQLKLSECPSEFILPIINSLAMYLKNNNEHLEKILSNLTEEEQYQLYITYKDLYKKYLRLPKNKINKSLFAIIIDMLKIKAQGIEEIKKDELLNNIIKKHNLNIDLGDPFFTNTSISNNDDIFKSLNLNNLIGILKLFNYYSETIGHLLNFKENSIKEIPIQFAFYSENITELNLKNNQITHFPPNFFKYLKKLKTLNLKNNQLTKAPDVDECSGLKILYLNNNKISSLNKDYLHKNNKLKTLTLYDNPILYDEIKKNLSNNGTEALSINKNL